MRVGFVTKWFNRGQPVVARQLLRRSSQAPVAAGVELI